MRSVILAASLLAAVALAGCGTSPTTRAATGGIGGAAAGTVIAGPLGAVVGGVGGATAGAATAP